MNRNYYNCEMVKVDQNDFDEIMSKRVTMLSSLEDWTLEHIRMFIFNGNYNDNSCFVMAIYTLTSTSLVTMIASSWYVENMVYYHTMWTRRTTCILCALLTNFGG